VINTRLQEAFGPIYEDGVEIALRTRLGEGGEGSVHQIGDGRKLVAKIYKREKGTSFAVKTRKVRRLTAMNNERLRQAAAWPVSVLTDASEQPIGYLMEYLDGWNPLYTVYQLKSRAKILPGKDWSFLVRVARNLATCVHFVHDAGLVVGDLNESNVLVHGNAMVKLIDVDSFQVTVDGEVLTVDVGKSELTPPELQGRSLDGRVRSPNEDNFALAVLVFHMLVFGRHPYAGRPKVNAEYTLETCIEQGYYAYTSRRQVPITPPPHLDISWLPKNIREMFEDAFQARADARPTAHDWYLALKELEGSLASCDRGVQHIYWSELGECPWCTLETRWHVPLFGALPKTLTGDDFDIDSLWNEVCSVQAPLVVSPPAVTALVPMAPVEVPLKLRAAARIARVSQFFFYLWVVWLQLAIYAMPAFIVAMSIFVLAEGFVLGTGFRKRYKELDRWVKANTSQLDELNDRWKASADPALYQNKLRELAELKERYKNISARYDELRFAELRRHYGPQLENFLRKYSVEVADISWVTKDQLDELLRNNITTAADLTRSNLSRRYRASEAMVEALLTWRNSLESHYWSTTNHDLSAQSERSIQRQLATEKFTLRTALDKGKLELADLARSINEANQSLHAEIESFRENQSVRLAEWEAYQKLLGKPTQPSP
jgi:DNA-binding helix-hairpin-helix protein with protein kinase domain